MVALADNLVEISTQLPRYENALDKRCCSLKRNPQVFHTINRHGKNGFFRKRGGGGHLAIGRNVRLTNH